MTPNKPSNHTLRFPRTMREEGWHGDNFADQVEHSSWAHILGYVCVGIIGTWLFFMLVLGLAP